MQWKSKSHDKLTIGNGYSKLIKQLGANLLEKVVRLIGSKRLGKCMEIYLHDELLKMNFKI